MSARMDSSLLGVVQRANVLAIIRTLLLEEGFVEIDVPELVVATGACEDFYMYTVEAFGDLAFLRQTGQLYLEQLVARGLDKAYCEGQSFRKEPSSGDGRHLCEFRLIEMEQRDMDFDELVTAEVRALRYIVDHLSHELFDEQERERLHDGLDGEIPRITYREALTVLEHLGTHLEFGDAHISPNAEQLLIHEFGKDALAIIKHPTDIKFFNMEVCVDDPTVVNSCDLILRGAGETFGSSVRETDPESMRQRLHNKRMYTYLKDRANSFAQECARMYSYSPEFERQEANRIAGHIDQSFEEYFALFRNNLVHRAGYGLGVGRLLQYILGAESINQAVTFPITRQTFH